MKKKAGIIASSVAAIAVCSSLIAGSTFALFTSESEVNIAVTSGNVEVIASVKNVATYSQGVKQTETETEEGEVVYNFENGGFASVSGNALSLNNVTPMDSVEFDIGVENKSNVTVKYRASVSYKNDTGLFDALDISLGGVEYSGETASTLWTTLEAGATVEDIHVVIALPEAAGNEYKNKSCTVVYSVEAVQGNADVADNGVKVSLNYNEEYLEKGFNAEERIKAAEAVLAKPFETLSEAVAAYNKLYSNANDGNYVYVAGNGVYMQNANPFYVAAGHYGAYNLDKVNNTPVASVEFDIGGIVEYGQGNVSIGGNTHPASVKLTGHGNDSKIINAKGISTYVAGGYVENNFVKNGSFTVSNIEFISNGANISLGVTACTANRDSAKRAEKAALNVLNCKFDCSIYNYNNDSCPETLEANFVNCSFNGENAEGAYAIHMQSDTQNTAYGFSWDKIKIDGCTFENFKRGINIEAEGAEAVISGNTFKNTTQSDRSAIQLTKANSVEITGNTLENIGGNAIQLYRSGSTVYGGVKTVITGNKITNARGFLFNEAGITEGLTVANNTFDNTNENAYVDRDGNVQNR